MNDKNKEILKAFYNQTEKIIPVSFWHHFAKNEFKDATKYPGVIKENLNGLKNYLKTVNPDFVKLMSDGFFIYPFLGAKDKSQLKSYTNLKTLPDSHPWFTLQKKLIDQQHKLTQNKLTFYNIFSPLTMLKYSLIDHNKEPLAAGDRKLADFYEQDRRLLKEILLKLAIDIKKQVDIAISSGINGIYYSTQTVQDQRTQNKTFFENIQKPIDLDIISEINKKSTLNILHICGFAGAYNNLKWFKNYPLQIINWSTKTDNYSLEAGKRLFSEKPVLGGFGNEKKDLLYSGNKAEIQNETRRLIAKAGKKGVILGADCTIPKDTPLEHIKWIQETAHNIS